MAKSSTLSSGTMSNSAELLSDERRNKMLNVTTINPQKYLSNPVFGMSTLLKRDLALYQNLLDPYFYESVQKLKPLE